MTRTIRVSWKGKEKSKKDKLSRRTCPRVHTFHTVYDSEAFRKKPESIQQILRESFHLGREAIEAIDGLFDSRKVLRHRRRPR